MPSPYPSQGTHHWHKKLPHTHIHQPPPTLHWPPHKSTSPASRNFKTLHTEPRKTLQWSKNTKHDVRHIHFQTVRRFSVFVPITTSQPGSNRQIFCLHYVAPILCHQHHTNLVHPHSGSTRQPTGHTKRISRIPLTDHNQHLVEKRNKHIGLIRTCYVLMFHTNHYIRQSNYTLYNFSMISNFPHWNPRTNIHFTIRLAYYRRKNY